MFKDKVIKLYKGIRCYLGIHNYKLGVAWAPDMRKDECSNPLCHRFTATYGHSRTTRWKEDKKGWTLFVHKVNADMERRKVIIEKFKEPEPFTVEMSNLRGLMVGEFEDAL